MKKLHGFFLSLMLLVAPTYSMQVSYVFLSALVGMIGPKAASYAQKHFFTDDGLNMHAIKGGATEGASLIGWLFSACYVKADFCLEKITGGRWKSDDTKKKEEEKTNLAERVKSLRDEYDARIHNLKEEHKIFTETALLNQQTQLKETFKIEKNTKKKSLMNKIESIELENKMLREQVQKLLLQQKAQSTVDEFYKILAEKDRKHAEEIAQMEKKFESLTTNDKIKELNQKNQTLTTANQLLKNKLETRSLFTNINAFTLSTTSSFDQPTCPNCKTLLNPKNFLLRE